MVELSALSSYRILIMPMHLLPRSIECRRCLAMEILSVRLSVSLIMTKRKKDLSIFLCHTKDHLA